MDQAKLKKILIGAALAIAGALAAYGINEVVPFLEKHPTWGPAIAALASVVLNAVRKWIQQEQQEQQING